MHVMRENIALMRTLLPNACLLPFSCFRLAYHALPFYVAHRGSLGGRHIDSEAIFCVFVHGGKFAVFCS